MATNTKPQPILTWGGRPFHVHSHWQDGHTGVIYEYHR